MHTFIINEKTYVNYSVEDIGALLDKLNMAKGDKERIINEGVKALIVSKRSSAYKSESDPLYMEWQFDQTEESERAWRDKVAEIKLRYPLTDPT